MQDTTLEATAIQAGILRKLSGGERLQIALDMSIMVRELSKKRLRLEHPEWSDSDFNRELLRYASGSSSLLAPGL